MPGTYLNLFKTVPKWHVEDSAEEEVHWYKFFFSSSCDVIHLEEDNDDENFVVDLERPLSKKATEERERKSKDSRERDRY
jgi:hypothetical protein